MRRATEGSPFALSFHYTATFACQLVLFNLMVLRIVCIAIALVASSCQDRIASPACSPDAPVMMGDWNGVPYRVHLQDALRCSRETGRPVLLLFTGYGAEPTKATWDRFANDDLRALINDRLLLCVVMVDDRRDITPEHLIDFPQLKSPPVTIGQRNYWLESEYFGKKSQPLFTLVNADFVSLAEPLGYIPNKEPELLVNWIEATLEQLP